MKNKDQYDRLLKDLRKKKDKEYDDLLREIVYRFGGQMLIDNSKKYLREAKDKMKELKESIPEMEKFIKTWRKNEI